MIDGNATADVIVKDKKQIVISRARAAMQRVRARDVSAVFEVAL